MSSSPPPVPQTESESRRTERVYVIVLALVAVLAVAAYIGIHEFDSARASASAALDLSARERASAERIVLLAVRLTTAPDLDARASAKQQMRDALDGMRHDHAALLQTAADAGMLNVRSAAVQSVFSAPTFLDRQATDFAGHAAGLLATPDDQLGPDNPDLAYMTGQANADLLSAFDSLDDALQIENVVSIARLNQTELAVLLVILAALAIQSLAVFRPLHRRIAEHTRRLSESQKQLDAVLDTIGEAIVAVDPDNQIVRVNQEVERIWGYSETDLLGARLELLLAPRYREAYSRAGDLHNLGERIEIEGLRADGTVFPLEFRISRALADPAMLFAVAMRDISDRKLTEAQIQHQLETIRALYVSSQKLAESLDMRSLADDVTRACVEEFGANLAWLGHARPDGTIEPFAHFPGWIDYPQQVHARWDDPAAPEGAGPHGIAIRTGEPVVVRDIEQDERFLPWREVARQHGFRSTAVLPLISRSHPFGVLSLKSADADFFTPERMQFFQSYAHQAAAALENARLFAEDRKRLERMQALRSVDMAITASLDLRVTLNVMLDQIVNRLGVDAAMVLLLNPQTQAIEHAADRGFRYAHVGRTRVRLGKGLAGRAALERTMVSVPQYHESMDEPQRAPLLAGENFVAYYAVPLHAKGQIKGVLEIFNRSPLKVDPDWLSFLEALAAQAAIAIDNATLFDGLQRSNLELALAYDDTLQGWSTALDLRDRETEGHTLRVTELAVRLARVMGLNDEDLVQLHRGSLLHDIGKMAIPDNILLKEGPLTPDEWRVMRKHPEYAFEMLSPIAYLRPALDIPYCHHERWDGSGYPRGLKGEGIPLSARIFALADVWDAVLSDRPYRHAWTVSRAHTYVQSLAGTQFDPGIVETFLSLVAAERGAERHDSRSERQLRRSA